MQDAKPIDEQIAAAKATKDAEDAAEDQRKKTEADDKAKAKQPKAQNLYRRKSDRQLYALQIVEDKPPFLGRTHVANNSKSHWAGTKVQFVAQFEPVDGTGTFDPKPSSGPVPQA